ncbi:SagB family peptide dehydrogenase [soil metagenome]
MTERDSGYQPLRYHELTKHSPASVRTGTHRIDWMDQPEPFKDYLELDPIPLPKPARDTGFPVSNALLGELGERRRLDAEELSRLLVLAAGVKSVRPQPSGKPVYLRNYACAGALYPIEAYAGCSGITGVDDGLYHYSPLDDALRLIRPGDPRPHLVRAAGFRPSLAEAPLTVILTGIPWRTNWKYRARGYRHLYWDSGMIVANLLALSASGGHTSEVVMGFVDDELNRLVGIDGRTEMSLCLVPMGFGQDSRQAALPAGGPAAEVNHPVSKLSFRSREYDEVLQAHLETTLESPAEAQFWQQDPYPNKAPPPSATALTGIEKTIRRRGSKRTFGPASILQDDLEGIVSASTYRLDCDWGQDLTQVGLIANAVDGLEPGAYSAEWGFQQIAFGNLREKAKFLCLEQDLGGDASVTMFLLTDLEDAYTTLEARSYRAAQLNAGIVGGRIYLGAYASGLGATGLTFYDDEVRKFFQTSAEPMLVVAVGR